MPSLSDLPSEVVLEHLLPALPLRDILALSAVDRSFNTLSNDPTFWRLKTLNDFTFPASSHPASSSSSASSASGSGWWKRVYLGLIHPKAYVWGASSNNRLGKADLSSTRRFSQFVDIPCEIRWDHEKTPSSWRGYLRDSLAQISSGFGSGSNTGYISSPRSEDGTHEESPAGVVDLQAGGWSFTARCADGSIWVWGQMDGPRTAFRSSTWEDRYCPVVEPTRILLPCRLEAMSAGRRHLLVLDADNIIWELRAWGKAFHHTSASLTSPSGHGTSRNPPHIVQLTTGWDHSAALTATGDIHIWYPFSSAYEASLTPDDQLTQIPDAAESDDNRGLRWGAAGNDIVHTLPPLPIKPKYEDNEGTETAQPERGLKSRNDLEAEWERYASSRSPKSIEVEQRVVKIASGEDFIVALKQNGEVWLARVKEWDLAVWQYLPYFSSPSITHLTAQFRTLTTYATPTTNSSTTGSTVCHARLPDGFPDQNSGDNLLPEHLPDLQNRGVIQVAIGDHHYAALTDRGELLTWGEGSLGRLGRGADRSGEKPTKVDFGPPASSSTAAMDKEGKKEEDSFVFAITAGGCHTGALVLGSTKHDTRRSGTAATTGPQHQTKPEEEERSASDPAGQELMDWLMPGGFPHAPPSNATANPGSSQSPTHDAGAHGVRAMPFFRVGFAGRGANIGGGRVLHPSASTPEAQQGQGRGRGQGQNQSHSDETDGEAGSAQGGRGRGAPIFRVGFAGRGGRGHHGATGGNGVGFDDNGPE